MEKPTKLVPLKLIRNLAILPLLAAGQGITPEGDMGTGVPNFGIYSPVAGFKATVWGLDDATTPFPAGCTSITLTPATMGLDTYKISLAVMIIAKASNRRVRFYAHATRDSGCGVDYIQLI